MTSFTLIIRTLRHFLAGNLATAAGIAIATAVISGALIIGDSLSNSLELIVDKRLGDVTHTVTAGERIFTRHLASDMAVQDQLVTAAVLKTEAVVSLQGSSNHINKVQIWGIDDDFLHTAGSSSARALANDNEMAINTTLAGRLGVDTGDYVLVRMQRLGIIPSNTPLVADNDQTITRRLKVSAVLDQEVPGNFHLQSSQTSALNAFVNIDWLNRIMGLDSRANIIVAHASQGYDSEFIARQLRAAWTPDDGNISIDPVQLAGQKDFLIATSGRVFFDHYLSETFRNTNADAIQVFSYFVNEMRFENRHTPYSFVAAIRPPENFNDPNTNPGWLHPAMHLQPGQALVNAWLADDQNIAVGDSLDISYYNIGPLRELTENQTRLKVVGIVSMDQSQHDTILIPHLPGLSDAGNCRDWDAGIPIDLDAIRQKDEDYWDSYKSAPKLYMSFEQAASLWENRFGNTTGILLPGGSLPPDNLSNTLRGAIDPMQLGFQVNSVRQNGIEAARGGVDFGQLFLGLGIFIIVGGLLLSMLLLSFSIAKRKQQIRLFANLGFGKALIQKIFLWEAIAVSLIGAVSGMILSVAYSQLIFNALNKNWYDIVRTESLQLFFLPQTLAFSLIISWLTGIAVVFFGVRRAIRQSLAIVYTNAASSTTDKNLLAKHQKNAGLSYAWLIVAGIFLSVAGVIIYLVMSKSYDLLYVWLGCGIALLASGLLAIHIFLRRFRQATHDQLSISKLSWRNLVRNPLRSFTIISLLALGSFVITVTAANRKEQETDYTVQTSGTGGFHYMAEVTVPILRNLNQPDSQMALGLPENITYVQFTASYDDDASCLNLNMVANPRILATDPENLQGRFAFVSTHASLNEQNPWMTLNANMNGVIPAIADQTVIQWGLGKKVGDTLYYINARGEQIKLLLVGGLANSVFQGHVIISDENFMANFPGNAGSQLLLLETAEENSDDLQEDLSLIFRDHGWIMSNTLDILAAFNRVENTYLQIFFLMGAFGILLGTVGLAVVMAKNMIERRSETALLRAIGFRTSQILRLFFVEFSWLFFAGMFLGILSALVATLPNFLAANQNVPVSFLFTVLIALTINGIFWMLLMPLIMIKKLSIKQALVND